MYLQLSLIGFGEAGRAFAPALISNAAKLSAYDIASDDPAYREAFKEFGISGYDDQAEALIDANLILSIVTADQQQMAAKHAAPLIEKAAIYCDMNSVAPDSKRAAAEHIEKAGAHYVDVAIMAPVHPARENVPLLISGPHAAKGNEYLSKAGFTDTKIVGDEIGQASAIKMIRSVMIKGIEALTAECVEAAGNAGVRQQVLESLGTTWPAKAAYNLERMQTHGLRRAAEMEEAVKTLESLNVEPVMTRGTVIKQRKMAGKGSG